MLQTQWLTRTLHMPKSMGIITSNFVRCIKRDQKFEIPLPFSKGSQKCCKRFLFVETVNQKSKSFSIFRRWNVQVSNKHKRFLPNYSTTKEEYVLSGRRTKKLRFIVCIQIQVFTNVCFRILYYSISTKGVSQNTSKCIYSILVDHVHFVHIACAEWQVVGCWKPPRDCLTWGFRVVQVYLEFLSKIWSFFYCRIRWNYTDRN